MTKYLIFALGLFMIFASCENGNDKKAQELAQKEKELQQKEAALARKNAGDFPEASNRPLSEEELSKLSQEQLGIMRNEIFARHGYIFKPGKYADHFGKQDWYKAEHKDVGDLITDLEKKNIGLIKEAEQAQEEDTKVIALDDSADNNPFEGNWHYFTTGTFRLEMIMNIEYRPTDEAYRILTGRWLNSGDDYSREVYGTKAGRNVIRINDFENLRYLPSEDAIMFNDNKYTRR